jgi:hypothetical protein
MIRSERIWQAWNWFWAFLSDKREGMGMKRVITLMVAICDIHLHYRFVDDKNMIMVLQLDYVFICVLLGLVLLPEVMKLFKGGQ